MDGGPTVVITTMDGHTSQDADRPPSSHHAKERSTCAPIVRGRTSDNEAYTTDGVPSIRQHLRSRGISEEGANIILASWKPGTGKQYRPHLKRWTRFCNRWDVSPFDPTVSNIINFLSETFNRNVGYEAVNTARSALSSLGIVVNGCRAGNHPLVIRFMKGNFNLRPPSTRYTETWDVQPVLSLLRSMYPLHILTLKDLSLKLVTLMALTQAARVQTLHLLCT